MWSLHAALDGRSACILGVGHFTVPPDVIVERRDSQPVENGEVIESPSAIRTIVVPYGITAVQRRSPIKARKRTPWRPSPESHEIVDRGGSREWFTDRLFVETKPTNVSIAWSTSVMVHAVLVLLGLLLLAAGTEQTDWSPRRVVDVSLRMPPMELLLPIAVALPAAPKLVEHPLPAAPRQASPPVRRIEAQAAAPLETPSSIEAEPTTIEAAPVEAAVAGAEADGATGGVTGGVAGGTGSGLSAEPAAPPAATSPFRVGGEIARPRKVKDVRPVYPQPAMSARVGGNVLIEATIGVDGKVHNARVLRSIALLDQAALDAVRQWEFEPSRLNGEAVAVTMVIIVTFALL
jgi:protein TonB